MKLKNFGWVWEGQGFDPGVHPSIFGVGEGAEFFGLSRAVYMFHPNNNLAMKKMNKLDELICDIAKWKYRNIGTSENPGFLGAVEHWIDGSVESICREANIVSKLSLKYPNITGAYHDDMKGLVKKFGCLPSDYTLIYEAVKSANSTLKLWSCVYDKELEAEFWEGFSPYLDVINFWVWESRNLFRLDEYLERVRELFPGKPINLGVYLRDYSIAEPVPMSIIKFQMEKILKYVQEGTIEGFSILGAVLIDGQLEQSEWIRDFIAAN